MLEPSELLTQRDEKRLFLHCRPEIDAARATQPEARVFLAKFDSHTALSEWARGTDAPVLQLYPFSLERFFRLFDLEELGVHASFALADGEIAFVVGLTADGACRACQHTDCQRLEFASFRTHHAPPLDGARRSE